MSILLILVQMGDTVQMYGVSAETGRSAECEASLHDAIMILQQSNANVIEVISRVSDATFQHQLNAWIQARSVYVADYKSDAHESASDVYKRYMRTLMLEVEPVFIPMRSLLWVETQ
jgi:hypothetical protein